MVCPAQPQQSPADFRCGQSPGIECWERVPLLPRLDPLWRHSWLCRWLSPRLCSAFSTASSFVSNGPVIFAVDASAQYQPSSRLFTRPKNTPTFTGRLLINLSSCADLIDAVYHTRACKHSRNRWGTGIFCQSLIQFLAKWCNGKAIHFSRAEG